NGTAVGGTSITLFDGATPIGTTQTTQDGTWGIVNLTLAPGSHNLTATASVNGQTSPASALFAVTVDTQAPNAPVIGGFADDTGQLNDFATSDNTLAISGTAEANSTVTLFDNNVQIGTTTADINTAWTFNTGNLANGSSHSFTATATDAAGNVSLFSNVLPVL